MTATSRFDGATVAVVENGQVERTFRTPEAANRWENALYYNVDLCLLPGKWRKGDRLPRETRPRRLQWFYTTAYDEDAWNAERGVTA
jgi:hypothetical protein